ncbi:MAG: hypothetical protein WA418_18555, partial [Bradyrhizobium sp.]
MAASACASIISRLLGSSAPSVQKFMIALRERRLDPRGPAALLNDDRHSNAATSQDAGGGGMDVSTEATSET